MFDSYGIYVPGFADAGVDVDGASRLGSFGTALCEYYKAVQEVAKGNRVSDASRDGVSRVFSCRNASKVCYGPEVGAGCVRCGSGVGGCVGGRVVCAACYSGSECGVGCTSSVGGFERGDANAVPDAESVVEVDGTCRPGVESSSVERAVGDKDDESVVSQTRGTNYWRNKRKRENRKRKVRSYGGIDASSECSKPALVPEWRRGATPGGVVSEHRGVFAECSQDVQRELRESRARMLVARNEAAVVQARADKQRVEAMVKARVYELDVEARRLKLDKDRKKEITEALAALPAGYAETIASEGLTSSVPSLSDGSVSPDSSISVAQVNRMEETIKNLTTRVAELTADNTEAEVKLKARIDVLETELKRSKKMTDVVGQQFRGLADERPARKQYVSPFSFV